MEDLAMPFREFEQLEKAIEFQNRLKKANLLSQLSKMNFNTEKNSVYVVSIYMRDLEKALLISKSISLE